MRRENKLEAESILDRRIRVIGPHAPLFYEEPLHVVRAEGVWMFDDTGRRYLDVYNNVPHVGHCHPRVVDALCEQARTLNIHTRYLNEAILDYAERLTATLAMEKPRAMFCCTGTEANELAIRIARYATRASGIIVSDYSYHGNSGTLAAMTTGLKVPEKLGDNIRTVRVPDMSCKPTGVSSEEMASTYAEEVRLAVESLIESGYGVAALLFEPLFTSEALPEVPKDYIRLAVAHVRAAGGLYIADEVQGGFGRTGDHMWCHEAHDVVPDLVTMGKPMGNGHPLAACIVRADIAERFGDAAEYFNTFGGNPVSCKVGLAVLDVLLDENLVENAKTVGRYAREQIAQLAGKHALIRSVRGKGLFFGVELTLPGSEAAAQEARLVINHMRNNGVLISRIGRTGNFLKMRPPMPFSLENADQLVDTLDTALSAL